MKEDIVSQKIRGELSTLPIDTEARVLYLLVEIRKVLDHAGERDSILRFYCDWVVHTRMSRSFAKKFFDMVSSNNDVESSRTITFLELKDELRSFLIKHNLPTLLTDSCHWDVFRGRLIDILVDTPIEKIEEKVVGKFIFRKSGSLGIHFSILHNDGRKVLGRFPK